MTLPLESRCGRGPRLGALVALTVILLPLAALPVLAGQSEQKGEPQDNIITTTVTLTSPDAVLVSPNDAPTGATAPAPPPGGIPFRPTMDLSAYKEAKLAAASGAGPTKGGGGAAPLATPTLKGINVAGVGETEAGFFFPPDTVGAIGASQFVEVTNSHIDIYSKTTGARITSAQQGCSAPPCNGVPLANFFGYFAQTLFDPRVSYDPKWNRWVVTAVAFPESSTVQRFFFAISTTSSATGSWFIYNLNVTFFAGDFYDFPQLGQDQDALIFTANIFPAAGGVSADAYSVAKALVYNGLGFSVPVFTGLQPTLTPPFVLDQNSKTFLIGAPTSGTVLKLYSMLNTSRGTTLSGPVNITVPAYSVPPNAPQPSPCTGVANTLDTGDSRFVNVSTQTGNSLWQVHTIALGGFAAPKFYRIDTNANTVLQSGFFFATGTSFDFNASITANAANDAFVTWTATDPSVGTNAQVRFSGKRSADAGIAAGSSIGNSTTCLNSNFDPNFGTQRWGDYSAVTVDPSNSQLAWIVNEAVRTSAWGSRIGKIGF